jgi:hypothetical protein
MRIKELPENRFSSVAVLLAFFGLTMSRKSLPWGDEI